MSSPTKFMFKPEDFEYHHEGITQKANTDRANSILQVHLATLPRVTGMYDKTGGAFSTSEGHTEDTHTALLWGITEIEKKECEHKPPSRHLAKYTVDMFEQNCVFCGVKLKAKWEKI